MKIQPLLALTVITPSALNAMEATTSLSKEVIESELFSSLQAYNLDKAFWKIAHSTQSLKGVVNLRFTHNTVETTLLHLTTQNSDAALVKRLLEAGAHVDAKSQGKTALHLAIRGGDFPIAKLLVDHEANVKKAEKESRNTPLHLAAQFGAWRMLKLLIENGANLNEINSNGETPLHAAVRANSWVAINLLLTKGACASMTNTSGRRPEDLVTDPDILELFKFYDPQKLGGLLSEEE